LVLKNEHVKVLVTLAVLAGFWLGGVTVAWGQETKEGETPSANRAAAEALFQQGRKLMADGSYDEACAKLDASQKLDPGIGTLLFLGECYEKAGKLASSWRSFQEAADMAKNYGEPDREKIARVRAAALMPRVPRLVFQPEVPVEGLEIRYNASRVPEADWGKPLPVDPGSYDVVATAPGYEPWRETVKVPTTLSEPWTVRIPVLDALETEAAPQAATETSSAPLAPSDSSGASQETWGLIIGGVGAVALITSGIFGALAASKNSESKNDCSKVDENQCSPRGVALRDDALKFANVATVAAAVGGIAMATGGVLYFTASPGGDGDPVAAMLHFEGTF
jgi:hypothetical protein